MTTKAATTFGRFGLTKWARISSWWDGNLAVLERLRL
jgi:hypothetical protein